MNQNGNQKPCELCELPRVKGERYCRSHRAAKLREMVAAGYLPPKKRAVAPAVENGRPHNQSGRIESLADALDSYRDRANEAGGFAD